MNTGLQVLSDMLRPCSTFVTKGICHALWCITDIFCVLALQGSGNSSWQCSARLLAATTASCTASLCCISDSRFVMPAHCFAFTACFACTGSQTMPSPSTLHSKTDEAESRESTPDLPDYPVPVEETETAPQPDPATEVVTALRIPEIHYERQPVLPKKQSNKEQNSG